VPAAEAPKPKRTTRKAAATAETDEPDGETAPVSETTADMPVIEAPTKPRRATKVAAAKTAPLEPALTATDGVASDAPEPAAKPKRAAKKPAAVPSGEVAT
jgi:hypothetical protein